MQELPHVYTVEAAASGDGPVELVAAGIPPLSSEPPEQFGGPGDLWSPETLLVASVADCFVLSFRASARASSLPFEELRCEAEGRLERVERVTRFTSVSLRVHLTVPSGIDPGRGRRLLEKAERNCLVSRSLACPVMLEPHVSAG